MVGGADAELAVPVNANGLPLPPDRGYSEPRDEWHCGEVTAASKAVGVAQAWWGADKGIAGRGIGLENPTARYRPTGRCLLLTKVPFRTHSRARVAMADEEEPSAEAIQKMEALCEEFEGLCHELRYHQRE
jgi:hypothetical protein